MVRPNIVVINPVELKYYPFMISLNKYIGSCYVLSPKRYAPKETGQIFETFNMITNKDEAKAMTEHISCDCKYKFNSKICNSNQKQNNKTCQCECENEYSWKPSACICGNSKYLKIVADTSVMKS